MIEKKIKEKISKIEEKNTVKVLFACESGSRAWGFESHNSDYDVRFIYVRDKFDYLSIFEKRDVIECELDDNNIDCSGWDLKKALKLAYKSNPPLHEWLNSPIVYLDRGFAYSFSEIIEKFYNPVSSIYHYFHMAKNNQREYLSGDVVWLKKYLYVLRPILAIKFIEKFGTHPPTNFMKTAKSLIDVTYIPIGGIDKIISMKRSGDELGKGNKIPALSQFIEDELGRIQTNLDFKFYQRINEKQDDFSELLDFYFIETIME